MVYYQIIRFFHITSPRKSKYQQNCQYPPLSIANTYRIRIATQEVFPSRPFSHDCNDLCAAFRTHLSSFNTELRDLQSRAVIFENVAPIFHHEIYRHTVTQLISSTENIMPSTSQNTLTGNLVRNRSPSNAIAIVPKCFPA